MGKYDIDGDKVFLVVQENVLNKEENDRFEHHKKYADLHLLVEGHEFSSYGSRIKDEALHLTKHRTSALFIVRNISHFIWVIIILRCFPGELTSQMAMRVRKIKFENIYLKF